MACYQLVTCLALVLTPLASSTRTGAVTSAEEKPNQTVMLVWGLISLVIFCISTYFVYKWHNEMKDKGLEPHCGVKSCLCVTCCLCCGVGTCFTICFPIDESEPKQ